MRVVHRGRDPKYSWSPGPAYAAIGSHAYRDQRPIYPGIGDTSFEAMDEQERRVKLKAFLRARRASLRPEALGMEAGPRRRTPGLRREEVAAAARVGVTWYTWLEQGRSIQPSRDALKRIARALRLTPTDESYFFLLVGEAPLPPPPTDAFAVDSHLRSMIDGCGIPVMLWGPFGDVLAYNEQADTLFSFDDYEGPFRANHIWRLFMDPKRRLLYEDFEGVAIRTVSYFRVLAASQSARPAFVELLDALRTHSQDFERLWSESTASAPLDRLDWGLRHPRLGRLRLARVALLLATEPDLTVVMLSGADAKTAAVLSRLTRKADLAPPP